MILGDPQSATLRWLADETTGDARAATTARGLDAARKRMVTTLRERAYVEDRCHAHRACQP